MSIESFDFSVNIWLQILEKTLDIRALFYHRGSAVLSLRSMAVLSNALLSGEAAKRARNTMRNIRSGQILSLHSLFIGKVPRALFVLQIIHLNLLILSVSCVRRDFLYLKVFFSNSCLFKSR